MMNFLNGHKTNIGGVGLMVFAILGFALGQLDATQAGAMFFSGVTAIGVGHKIDKSAR